MCVVQLATVCTKFREACTCVPSLRLGILLGTGYTGDHTERIRLDSKLVLSWAGHMTALEFVKEAHITPGLFGFIAAASEVSEVKMDLGGDIMTAALADHLLSKLTWINELSVWGFWLPSIYPLSLRMLSFLVGHPMPQDVEDTDYMEQQANMVLYRRERLPHLQSLCLKLDSHVAVRLTCSVKLHHLERLFVRFWVKELNSDLELAWLKRQAKAAHSLDLFLWLVSDSLSDHAAAIQELIGLKVRILTLDLRTSFPVGLQAMWSACRQDAFQLAVCSVEAFSSAANPLQVLPRGCQNIVEVQGPGPEDFYMDWSALTTHAGSFRIQVDYKSCSKVVGVHLLGDYDAALVESYKQPWQLVVSCMGTVSGIPGPSLPGSMYLMQNSAARAAGLTAAWGAQIQR